MYQSCASRKKLKAGVLHHSCWTSELISAEENCRTEDALKGSDQAAIFRAAFVHTENFEHLTAAPETNRLALLLDRERCQEDWNNTVLSEWHSEFWMPGNLQDELSVALLIDKPPRWKSSHR